MYQNQDPKYCIIITFYVRKNTLEASQPQTSMEFHALLPSPLVENRGKSRGGGKSVTPASQISDHGKTRGER